VDLDRGHKLQFYPEISTVRHIVLAYEDRKEFEHDRRIESSWERTVLTETESVLLLQPVAFSMDLIYFDIRL
jgi:hypothetical protein